MLDLFWGRGGQSRASRESTTYLFNCFQFMGLTSTIKWKTLYHLYSAFISLSVFVFFPLTFTLSLFLLSGNLSTSEFLTSLQTAMNVYALLPKVLTIKLNMNRLRESNDIMDALDGRCHLRSEYRKIRNCIYFCNRTTVCFTFTYVLSSVLTLLSALHMGRPPFVLYMIPLDWRNSNWEFVLQTFIQHMLITYGCFYQSSADAYAVIYIYIMRTHMQILVERVRRLGTEETKTKDMNYEELVECIKDYQNLLRLYNKISPVISGTVFTQFAVTAAILGTIMINILIFADTSSQIASMMYFVAVLTQTAPCCYQATYLLDDCEQLPLAIMHCNWMEEDKRFRKMLIFFMHRSQQPMALTAMKLFPITLNTNLSIAKFSFSLYTLIENMDFGRNRNN